MYSNRRITALFFIFKLLLVESGRIPINYFCKGGRGGTCIDVWKCPFYANLLNQSPRPPYLIRSLRANICGFSNAKTPKVCCIIKDNDKIIPLKNHENHHLLPFDSCGPLLAHSRITKGSNTSPREFPWMALIAYKTGESPKEEEFKCGGSLINSGYVLTAAHCLDDTSVLGVRLGEYNLETERDCFQNVCEHHVQDILINKIIIHPEYNPVTFVNDIALIRLATPANLSTDNVKPICLPLDDTSDNIVGKMLTVTGWGVTELGHGSKILRKALIPVLPLTDCLELYNQLPITEKQICAGGYKGRDSCAGDSGGPLQYLTSDETSLTRYYYVQYGIVSFGPSVCGLTGLPAIYTNVKEYVTWILDNLEPI